MGFWVSSIYHYFRILEKGKHYWHQLNNVWLYAVRITGFYVKPKNKKGYNMSKNGKVDLLAQLNSATLNRRSFLKWSAATGATAMLASNVDLLNGIQPLTTAHAQSETTIIPTGCAHNCGGRCVLKAHVQDGVVVRVTSDTDRPDDPLDPQLRACVRGRSYRRRVYAPDRLRSPLRRTGERGSGIFEEISWDEAADIVAENLIRIKEEYGNAAIYPHYATGAGNTMNGSGVVNRLLALFGGYLRYYNNYSWAAIQAATPTVYGTQTTGQSRMDWLNSRMILMWGWNPAEMIDGTNTMYFVRRARENGAKTIVIDPRHSMSAVGLADEWIPIRPGTDAAMMAAMAYILITEGLVDEDFVNTYSLGYDDQHMPEGYESGESSRLTYWVRAMACPRLRNGLKLSQVCLPTLSRALLGNMAQQALLCSTRVMVCSVAHMVNKLCVWAVCFQC
jgi:anaerobic dimethyl sulfoxide reductase subunit A